MESQKCIVTMKTVFLLCTPDKPIVVRLDTFILKREKKRYYENSSNDNNREVKFLNYRRKHESIVRLMDNILQEQADFHVSAE